IKLVWALCVPLVALYVFAGQPLVHIFLDSPTGQAMDTGVAFLRIIAPFYFIVSAKLVSDGVLRGAGLMKKFMVATFTDLVLRVALAEAFAHGALCNGHLDLLAHQLDDHAALSIVFYATVRWEKLHATV
ncbi:MAG: MATE family efflux transporter, partial [Oscillospiraceae bacterium]